jgi:hypothetical protein
MDELTNNGNPGHGEPIDQKGSNRTPKSVGVKGPDDQEYGGQCGHCEQCGFLESFHVSAFTMLSRSAE